MTQAISQSPVEHFERSLTLWDAVGIVICGMIGSGIFIVSSQTALELQSTTLVLFAWLLAGGMTVAGALAYGELASMYPNVGGQYVYIKQAWGDLPAFLYGWALSFVIKTGSIAAVAIGFAKFLSLFIPALASPDAAWTFLGVTFTAQKIVAAFLILTLSFINTRGVKLVAQIQNAVTLTNILALTLVILTGVFWGANLPTISANLHLANPLPTLDASFLSVLGIALVGPLFALDGWNNVTFVASEIKQPEKNLPWALLIGTGLTSLLYILVNAVYFSVLPFQAVIGAKDGVVGAEMMRAVLGQPGTFLLAGIIMVAAFGCVNSMILSGSRALYSLAKDCTLLKSAATLGEKSHVPETALYLQCAWSILLLFSRSFFDLLDYMVFAQLLFYAVTVAGLFILRRKSPNGHDLPIAQLEEQLERSAYDTDEAKAAQKAQPNPIFVNEPSINAHYKTWAYPYLPTLFCILCLWISLSLLFQKPISALISLFVTLSGLPFYWLSQNKTAKPAESCMPS